MSGGAGGGSSFKSIDPSELYKLSGFQPQVQNKLKQIFEILALIFKTAESERRRVLGMFIGRVR